MIKVFITRLNVGTWVSAANGIDFGDYVKSEVSQEDCIQQLLQKINETTPAQLEDLDIKECSKMDF